MDGRINPQLDDEEIALLKEFREVRRWGFGKIEVSLVNGQLESLNRSEHKKRKDVIFSPRTT